MKLIKKENSVKINIFCKLISYSDEVIKGNFGGQIKLNNKLNKNFNLEVNN